MGVVAVAGGTGDVGRTIVDQLVLSGKHEVLVLGRKAPKETTPRSPAFAVVDYDHVNETTKLLNERNVDTIISAMSPSTASRQSEIKLIAAAQASSAVKRFIPSEYEGDVLLSLPEEGLSADDTPKRAADALAASDLKFTRIANGIFMDYFGIPNIPSHLAPFIWAIDISSRRAVIPGDGNHSVSLTYSRDVARYIDRLLDEDEWPPVSIMSGSDITLNEMLAVAERVTGDKFDVAHDELSDLKMGKTTPLRPDAPSYQGFDPVAMNAAIGVALVEGQMVLPKNGRLNERFPEVRPMSFEEMVTDAWSRRE